MNGYIFIYFFLHFTQNFKMAAKIGRKRIFEKSRQYPGAQKFR